MKLGKREPMVYEAKLSLSLNKKMSITDDKEDKSFNQTGNAMKTFWKSFTQHTILGEVTEDSYSTS